MNTQIVAIATQRVLTGCPPVVLMLTIFVWVCTRLPYIFGLVLGLIRRT